ncbi:glycosyltransferase family 4 protein [Aureisphaera sp. CAU 1614]|uniref:Glycosyltransferase family 4 protein n=1 Tax=Halomarinibacterium sedimenti TaxID=2857106 RepID=A0A9X1FNY3_9FLAO|nr:glycosyltransferase family 4 protein [Halomarinibacterium sedimenti]MBW2937703.1 glycosyltransferase family 4 protein [Halomarinibacterium sedimenti]
MNIVFLSAEYPLWAPGGVGTFLQTFGRSLAMHGHTITILGVGVEENEVILEDEGVTLIRLPKNKTILPNFLYNAWQLNKRLKLMQSQNPIDIIESAELGLAIISKKHPAKMVIRMHGGHHFFAEAEKRGINWRKGLLEKKSFKKADGFIAVSQYVKDHTAKYLTYHNKPIEIINYPINTSLEIPKISIQNNKILFAGTVCEKKGVRQLIEAFKIVRTTYPEKELDIYGRDWFYPNGDSYIEKLKQDYDASYFINVVFHGTIERELLNLKYREAGLCVFPSHMETQGLVTLEAMLLQKPVIFSQYGPGPETIIHEETGLLCDVYDPIDIAEKIIWCIKNPDKANLLGIKAEKVVRKKYDKSHILEKNLAFYDSLIS